MFDGSLIDEKLNDHFCYIDHQVSYIKSTDVLDCFDKHLLVYLNDTL